MIVIKLGGSLVASSKIKSCLNKIEHAYEGDKVVIVPGGGEFANQVRCLQKQYTFDDRCAHQMAILAMQQMALLFNSIKPHFKVAHSISQLQDPIGLHTTQVWSPDTDELDQASIPSTWSITSDSLSAWLANYLKADGLILIKSVSIGENIDIRKLVRDRVVDASFSQMIQQAAYKVTIVDAEKFLS